jgi:hypothetical protein
MFMNFSAENFDKLLPEYLSSQDKDRLKRALIQFHNFNKSRIDYNRFFETQQKESGWFQGDIVLKLRLPNYDEDKKEYLKEYRDCLILSNSCDITPENERLIAKQVVVAPLVEFNEFSNNNNRIDEITNQRVSNLLYIPVTSNNRAYVAYLDKLSWFPVSTLNSKKYLENQKSILLERLSLFGLYLLLVKLSFHFCRVPEDNK